MHKEPDSSRLAERVRRLLKKCLKKDPNPLGTFSPAFVALQTPPNRSQFQYEARDRALAR